MNKLDLPQVLSPEVITQIETALSGESLEKSTIADVVDLFFTRQQSQEDAKIFLAQAKKIIRSYDVDHEEYERLLEKLIRTRYLKQKTQLPRQSEQVKQGTVNTKEVDEKLEKLVDSTADMVVGMLYREITGGICRAPFESAHLLKQLPHERVSQIIDRSLSLAIRVLPISEVLQYFMSLNRATPEEEKILAILEPKLEETALAAYAGLPSEHVDEVMALLIQAFARLLALKMHEIYVSKFKTPLQNGEITHAVAVELISESLGTAAIEMTVIDTIRAAANNL